MISFGEYKRNYIKSIEDVNAFVTKDAAKLLNWDTMFTAGYDVNNEKYFVGGKLNACYNVLDRHVKAKPDKTAFIVFNNNDNVRQVTYKELYDDVLKKAFVFASLGLKTADVVTFYGNNSYDFFASVLACGRLGLVCHFIFGGFSAEVVAERLIDTNTKLILTIDTVQRGEKVANYMSIVLDAINLAEYCGNVIVFDTCDTCYANKNIKTWSVIKDDKFEYTECVSVLSDTPFIIIFTSGSSGKSKGIVHGTGGFLYGTMMSINLSFGYNGLTDIFLSTADIGWMACVSHSIYGPLLCGGTTVVFEGIPFYPSKLRLLNIIAKYKITHLYTAPTVVRMLRKFIKEDFVNLDEVKQQIDLNTLKVIGSVGEILNDELINFLKNLTSGTVHIINTYWQTETGTIMLSTLPIVKSEMHGVGLPVYCVIPKIVKVDSPKNLTECTANEKGLLLFFQKWPSLSITLLNDHLRYENTYFNVVPGYYYTGDEALKDEKGNIHILGRVDDVINVSGHRISTLEIENKLYSCDGIAALAVVGVPDVMTGQRISVNVVKTIGTDEFSLERNVREHLHKSFGKILGRYEIRFCEDLPQTRSGKFMRRVLRMSNSKLCDSGSVYNAD